MSGVLSLSFGAREALSRNLMLAPIETGEAGERYAWAGKTNPRQNQFPENLGKFDDSCRLPPRWSQRPYFAS